MTATRRVLIFDLDGTLIDTMGPLAQAFCDLMEARCGVPAELSRPIYIALAGKGPRPQFEEVLRQTESLNDDLLDRLTAEYWTIIEAFEPVAFPETVDVLTKLRRAGHTLIVSSGSTTASVQRKTRRAGFDGLLRLGLGTDDGVPLMAKGPGHFELIREALGISEAALSRSGAFVGDAVYDMQVARDARVLAVGRITDGNGDVLIEAGAHHLIRDLRELDALLDH